MGNAVSDSHETAQEGEQMKQCDFMTVLRSYKATSFSSFIDEPKRFGSINEAFSYISKRVSEGVPCITDEYSRLRYTTFFLERWGIVDDQSPNFSDNNKILKTSVQELQFALLAKKHGLADPLFRHARNVIELASLLKSIVKTKTWVSPDLVLDQLGQSPYIDSIVRDVVRSHILIWDRKDFCELVLQKIDKGIKKLNIVLDILAEHRLKILRKDKLDELLKRWEHDHEVFSSLLRYIGECDIKDFIPFLERKLQAVSDLPIFKAFAILDVLAQIGDKGCLSILEKCMAHISRAQAHPATAVLSEYAELASREIGLREIMQKRVNKKGAVLVQCAFYGDIARPGQSEGGGLATLLTMLGNSMARSDEWDRIYTLFLFSLKTDYWNCQLIEPRGDENHYIVRIPVSFPAHDLSNQFMIHEYEIMRAVQRALEQHCIDPDIFHIRYSDNASKALAILSKRLKKKLIFTLTPDPHRNLSGKNGRLLSILEEETLFNLNKVYIADRLVESADGIILIGHERKNDQIIPYFPALWIIPELLRKPLDIVPEGINMKIYLKNGESYDKFLELLTDHEGRYKLENAYMERPIILNAGRLNKVKGQHLLLDAWAQSKLSEIYNLVLVGGNLESPNSSENMILERIDDTMEDHPKLKGRFCLLSALPNREIRLFERAIMERINAKMPNVYTCSSIKEEFGISILEAMSVGFLAIAPLNGGVSSYIEDGKNGYLIETHNATAIKLGIESVLLSRGVSSRELRAIAKKGKAYVSRVFDIDKVARIFSRFYHNIIKVS